MNLAGVKEVAVMLGVTPGRIGQLVTRNARFPRPIATARSGRFWLREDIERFQQGLPPEERTPLDLLSNRDVLAVLGISNAYLHSIRQDPDQKFPDPVATLGAGPLWARPDIVEWNATWQHARE